MTISATINLSQPNAQAVLTTVIATNTVVINTHTFTCEASGSTGDQFDVGATDTLTAVNLAAAINGSVTSGIDGVITATSVNNIVYLKASGGVPIVFGSGSSTIAGSQTCGPFVDVLVQCVISNSTGTPVVLTGIQPTITPHGSTKASVAAQAGQAPSLPITAITVPATGTTLTTSWPVVLFAPQTSAVSVGSAYATYDIGAIITSPGSSITATVAKLSVLPIF